MTREEFIIELKKALAEEIPASEIENNIKYYNNYIGEQMQTKSEEQVLMELGEPRLIAKTIIEGFQMSQGPLYNNMKQRTSYKDAYTEEWQDEAGKEPNDGNDIFGNTGNSYHIYKNYELKWYHKVALAVMIVFILSVVIIIGGIILKLFFSIGIPLLIIYLVYRLIITKRNN